MLQNTAKADTVARKAIVNANAPKQTACNIVTLPKSANQVEPGPTCHAPKPTSKLHQTHWFKYAGRKWRLYKRSAQPEASWNIELRRHGIRQPHSLRTSSITYAEAEAKALIDRWLEGWRRPRREDAPSSLVDVLAVVPQLPITANAATRQSYAWSLRWVLRLALDKTDAQLDGLTAAVLSKDTARKFFAAVLSKANALPNQSERNTWLRTATTFYSNATCLFAPLPLDAMRTAFNLRLPDLSDFRNGRKLFLREKIAQGAQFQRPDDSVIRRTLVEWVRLARTPGYTIPGVTRHGPELSDLDRRNMFIAVGLALSCGLRAGEFTEARWRWFTVEKGRPLLFSGAVDVKNRSGEIRVRPLDPFWRILTREVDRQGWRGQPDAYCLSSRLQEQVAGRHESIRRGGECDRTWWPQWLVGKWLRWLGWTTQKSNHALRDLAASYVTMKFGLERAKIFCRHGQQSTTEAHYGRFVDEDVMDSTNALRWLRWA